jgi:hypothetical protein
MSLWKKHETTGTDPLIVELNLERKREFSSAQKKSKSPLSIG